MSSAGGAHKESGPPQGWPGKMMRVVQAAANAAAENPIEHRPA
jgi:hypothetical protein